MVNNPARPSEYAHLLTMQQRFPTAEAAEHEACEWQLTLHIPYEFAAAWFAQGAGYHDRQLLGEMVKCGLTPAITAASYRPSADLPPVTVMTALLSRSVSPAWVAQQVRDARRRTA